MLVLELDESLAPQADLFPAGEAEWLPARNWGPTIRLACTFPTFGRFRKWLAGIRPAGQPGITLYGSGDFHHVTLALLGGIREPFNLLVLDKHPDWMRGIPFLHCGTWLRHALRLSHLRQVFHCGGEADFENAYRWLAPWPEILAGRVIVFPARRQLVTGRWAQLTVCPLLSDGHSPGDVLRDSLQQFRDELERFPLYISIDKDVLTAEDAAVNWDSGFLQLADAVAIVQEFLKAAGGRLAGADVCGDWSPVRLGHWLNKLCDRLDHPSPQLELALATQRNRRANAALLGALSTHL